MKLLRYEHGPGQCLTDSHHYPDPTQSRGLWAGWDEGMPATCVSDFLARHAAEGGVLVGWEIHGDLDVAGFAKVQYDMIRHCFRGSVCFSRKGKSEGHLRPGAAERICACHSSRTHPSYKAYSRVNKRTIPLYLMLLKCEINEHWIRVSFCVLPEEYLVESEESISIFMVDIKHDMLPHYASRPRQEWVKCCSHPARPAGPPDPPPIPPDSLPIRA